MTRDYTKPQQGASILCLLEEYKNIESDIGSTPTLAQLEDCGTYSADDFCAAFGSYDALVEAARQPRNQILVAIRQERSKRGHTPKLSELRESEGRNIPDVREHFDTWEEALKAAGVLPTADKIVEAIQREQANLGQVLKAGEFLDRTGYRQVDYLYHFDSWDDALSAAGPEIDEDELHSEIRWVTDKHGETPTLAEFEDSAPYMYALYQRTDQSWMETLDDAGVLPSRDDIIQEINLVAEEMDRLPNAGEFTNQVDIRNAVYQYRFGNWITALDAAGTLPTKDELADHIRALSDELQPIPEQSNFLKKSKYPKSVYDYRFDSWEEALEVAGIVPTKQEFLSILRETDANNGWVNRQRFYADTTLPSGYHERFFSSWFELLDAAGTLPSEEELLQHLRDLEAELGHIPSRSEAIDDGKYRGTVYRFLFESWNETLDAAGLLPTRAELVGELQALADDVGRIPSETDISESGEQQPDIYRHRFGWLGGALEAAGLLDQELFMTEVKQVLAEQGPVVTPDEVYDASGIPEGYHERFYDSWEAVLEAAGALDGAFPAPIGERLQDLATEWGRPPSEEYARRHLGIKTGATLRSGHRISLDWEAMLEATGLDPGDIDPDADLVKEIEHLVETLEHRPNHTEVEKYLLKESNDIASRWEIDDVIERAAIPAQRDLTPTRSLTRQRYERNSSDVPSHTDLLVELNIIRSRTKSDKDAIESAFETHGVIDERHYSIQFGSVAAAIDRVLTIDARQFRAPIERNYSLTPGMLRESVRELGEILERPPLLEEVVFLGEASIADFTETFASWAEVTNTDSIVRTWSNKELSDDVEKVGQNLGKPPTHEELLELGTVPVQCLVRRFGVWPRVLWLLGVDIDAVPQEYLAYEFTSELWNTTDYLVREDFGHDHALFDELHRLYFEFERVPSEELVQRYSPYAIDKFTGEFGSITAATDRAGITASNTETPPIPSREKFLRDLQAVSEEAAMWVLPQDISLHTDYSVGTYIGAFDSLENALEKANLPTDHLVGPTETYSDAWHTEHQMKAAVLRAIADLASRDENEVTLARLQSVAGISNNIVYRFFNNWDEAREAAQVRESLGTVEVDPNKVENPDFVDDLLSEMDEMMEGY